MTGGIQTPYQMIKGDKKSKKTYIPPAEELGPSPSPAPAPAVTEEQIFAKDATKRKTKKKGRSAQIFAGRLNQQILNFGLKKKVGE